MHKPSSLISSITLTAFLQAQIASVWALPTGIQEQKPAPTLLYLGEDPYTQALLRLQYDNEDKSLELQLLNNGLVLTSLSHVLPETTKSVDSAVIYGGDQIVVAGRTSGKKWFIRALNSQGGFLWQRSGEGRVYDLAFSENGKVLYAVGHSVDTPLFTVVDADSGSIQFHAAPTPNKELKDIIYSQVIVSTDGVIVAKHNPSRKILQYLKWKLTIPNGESFQWQEESEFCNHCEKENITAVALQKNKDGTFLSITTDGSYVLIEQKDAAHGMTIYKMASGKWSGAVTWNQILRLYTHDNQVEFDDINLHTTQLLIAEKNCSLVLSMKGKPVLTTDFCESTKHSFSRRSILQWNSTEGTNKTWPTNKPAEGAHTHEEIAFRVLIEWIGGLIGVVSGGGILAAVIGGGCTLYKKYKNTIKKTISTLR